MWSPRNKLLSSLKTRLKGQSQSSNGDLYSPLEADRAEIRLVQILSDSRGKINCRLHTVSLDNDIEFIALSYLWGNPRKTEKIVVNDQTVSVGSNLVTALRHVRHHWGKHLPGRDQSSFRLWADAISINQDDVEEKNTQVPLMGRIYSRAELVIGWLGTGNRNVEIAFDLMKLISTETKASRPQEDDLQISWLKKYPDLCKNQTPGLDCNKHWTSLTELGRLHYWKRVWIFQEVVLAQKLVFTHGNKSLQMDDFDQAWTWIVQLRDFLGRKPYQKPSFLSEEVWSNFAGPYFPTFFFERFTQVRRLHRTEKTSDSDQSIILKFPPQFQATDPRDHIYGLLGLVNLSLVPNYENSLVDVYHDFVIALTQYHVKAEWLCHAGIGIFGIDTSARMPSWTPNYPKISQVEGISRTSFNSMYNDDVLEIFKNLPDDVNLVGNKLVVSALVGPNVGMVHEAMNVEEWNNMGLFYLVSGFVSRYPSYVTGIHPLNAMFQAFLNEAYRFDSNDILLSCAYWFLKLVMHKTESMGKSRREIFAMLGLHSGGDFEKSFVEAFLGKMDNPDWSMYEAIKYPENQRICAMHMAQIPTYYRFFETTEGYIGLAPKGTLPGDVISVVKGCPSPLVLRRVDRNYYILIGSCFVVGLTKEGFPASEMFGGNRIRNIEIW